MGPPFRSSQFSYFKTGRSREQPIFCGTTFLRFSKNDPTLTRVSPPQALTTVKEKLYTKEKMESLKGFLEEVVLGAGKPLWPKFFYKLGAYFNKRFGPDWKERDKFFKEFEESLRHNEQANA